MRTIQALPGHKEVETTMSYTPGLPHGGHGVLSPLADAVPWTFNAVSNSSIVGRLPLKRSGKA